MIKNHNNLLVLFLVIINLMIGFVFLLLGSLFVWEKINRFNGMSDLPYFTISMLAILGYLGLIRLFFNGFDKNIRSNFTLCLCAFIALCLTLTIAGSEAWIWFVTIQEWDEWWVFAIPFFSTFYFVIKLFKRLIYVKADS